MLVRRSLCLGLVGCVAACGIELSGGSVAPGGQDAAASSSSSSSSGASTSSSSSGGSSSGDASTIVDAAPDVPKVPTPTYKWRCVDPDGGLDTVSFGDPVTCGIDQVAKCRVALPGDGSGCGKLGDEERRCKDLCLDSKYTYDRACKCVP